MKYHTLSFLQRALRNAGLPYNKKTIFKWEKLGKLECPRSPTNYKIINGKTSYVRMFTMEQVEKIIKAFQPNGSGHWSYK